MAALLACAMMPLLAQARLGSGIVDLTSDTFDSFMERNSKVMVDFVDGKEDQTSELKDALRMIRDYGSKVPVARVDATKYSELGERYFDVGCSNVTQKCGDHFPQLLWFHHGQPTQYHRMLRKPQYIMSFTLAMDRDPIDTIGGEAAMENWNQVILLRCERHSDLYKTAEIVAGRHMDGAAFVHIEVLGGSEISWAVNGTIEDSFKQERTVDNIDAWVRSKLTLSEDVPGTAAEDGSVVVVGKTLEQLVLRDDADVMMIVYAPWCGFCRKAMPQWTKFATLLKDAPGAPVVAKMDGTLNRSPLPDMHWHSFPTIIYVRKGEKQPILFESPDRYVETFLDFAKQHSTSPIEVASEALMLMQQGPMREL